jgi:hypothetical protein
MYNYVMGRVEYVVSWLLLKRLVVAKAEFGCDLKLLLMLRE